jgi:MFS family permease
VISATGSATIFDLALARRDLSFSVLCNYDGSPRRWIIITQLATTTASLQMAQPSITFQQKLSAFCSSKPSKQYHLRNVIHVSVAILFLFTAFKGIENLASTYLGNRLGNVSIAVIYVVMTVACFFGPAIVQRVGIKTSFISGGLGVCAIGAAYLLAVIYDQNTTHDIQIRWGSLISGAVIFGFTAAPFWVAQGSYLTENAKGMSDFSVNPGDEAADDDSIGSISTLGLVSGIFWFIFKLTSVTAGLIASTLAGNSTASIFVAYLVCAVLGVIMLFFLRPANPHADPPTAASAAKATGATHTGIADGIKRMLSMWLDVRFVAMVPMIMYAGLQSGWLMGTFTSDYVTVSLGRSNLGYMIIAYGVFGAIFSLLCGKLSDKIGRLTVLLIGAGAQLVVAGLIVFGEPITKGGRQWVLIIVIEALWALGGATLNTGLSAILGEMFFSTRDAAFANMKLLQSVSTALSFIFPVLGLKPAAQTQVLAIVCIVGSFCVACLWIYIRASLRKHATEEHFGDCEKADKIRDLESGEPQPRG